MWFRVTPLLPGLQAHQLSKADSFHCFPCAARLHEQDRTQGSAPLKELGQTFVAKSTGAAWALWLQVGELTICTRSIQSDTQVSQQARFSGVRSTYVHSSGDLMCLLILRRSQSSPFSLLCSTLWKPTGPPHASQLACFLCGLCKFCHHLCPQEHYQLVAAWRQDHGLSHLPLIASRDSVCSKGHLWLNWTCTDHGHSWGFWDFLCLNGVRKLKIWGPIIIPQMENTFQISSGS